MLRWRHIVSFLSSSKLQYLTSNESYSNNTNMKKTIPHLLFFVITLSNVIVRDVRANNPPWIVWNPAWEYRSLSNVFIPENSETPLVVGDVIVEDNDAGPAGEVDCVLTTPGFRLNRNDAKTFSLELTTSLDRENDAYHEVTIRCRDNGSPSMTSVFIVDAYVTDVNDNAPRFDQDGYVASVLENSPQGELIFQFHASDPDSEENGMVRYSFINAETGYLFDLDPESGQLRVKAHLDTEVVRQINFRVKTEDYGTPPLSSEVVMHLLIEDANDNWPDLLTRDLSVTQGAGEGTVVGTLQAADRDLGNNGEVEFLLPDPPSPDLPFNVTLQGDVVTTGDITLGAGEEYRVRVTVRDKGGPPLSYDDYVTIHVTGGGWFTSRIQRAWSWVTSYLGL